MHVQIDLLVVGVLLALYGGAIGLSPRAAAYINKISLDKYWLPPHLTKYSVQYVDGAFALGLGATLIVAAFLG
jgi:hypothetical protein